MTSEEDRDEKEAFAAEYVLGSLESSERAQVEALMTVDHSFREVVRKWERRLGELNVLVAPVEPPPGTWERVKAAINNPTHSRWRRHPRRFRYLQLRRFHLRSR